MKYYHAHFVEQKLSLNKWMIQMIIDGTIGLHAPEKNIITWIFYAPQKKRL